MLPIALLLLGGLFLALALPDGSDDEVEEEENPPIESDDTDNALIGTEGDDDILGYAGNDRLDGEGGNDLLEGGDGYDSLYGGTGDDTLDGGTRDNLIYGGEGNDLLVSLEGYGVMEGGSGDDTLVSDGPKSLYGGEGNDIFQLELVTMEDQPYPTPSTISRPARTSWSSATRRFRAFFRRSWSTPMLAPLAKTAILNSMA